MDRLKAIQVFVEVCDRGSLSAAAVSLGMSRAMVSRYLAEMEQWSNNRLLHRTTRRMSLTPAGADILPRCRQVLDLARDLDASPHAGGETEGTVRLLAPPDFGRDCVAPAMVDYVRQFPGATVELQLTDRPGDLGESGADLSLCLSFEPAPSANVRKVGLARRIVCAAPEYLDTCGRPRGVEDLAGHACLTGTDAASREWSFLHAGARLSVRVQGTLSCNDDGALARAALKGAGIAVLPVYIARPWLAAGRLERVLADYESPGQLIYFLYSRSYRASPLLRSLQDFLVRRFSSAGWEDGQEAAAASDAPAP